MEIQIFQLFAVLRHQNCKLTFFFSFDRKVWYNFFLFKILVMYILIRNSFLFYSDLILSDLLSILNYLLMNTSTNLKNKSEKNHNNNNYIYDIMMLSFNYLERIIVQIFIEII